MAEERQGELSRCAIDGYTGNLGCRFHCGVSNRNRGIGGSHRGATGL
jgi:hypothetical protein